MIGSVGHRIRHIQTGRAGRIIAGDAGWIGITSTMVQYDGGEKDEVPDNELRLIDDDKAFVMSHCPTCKKLQPHKTVGIQNDKFGQHQRMECVVCHTSERVQTGEHGEKFQENCDAPTGM